MAIWGEEYHSPTHYILCTCNSVLSVLSDHLLAPSRVDTISLKSIERSLILAGAHVAGEGCFVPGSLVSGDHSMGVEVRALLACVDPIMSVCKRCGEYFCIG